MRPEHDSSSWSGEVNTSSPSPPDVWSLIDAERVRADDRPDLAGWMQRLCRAAARSLPAAGVGVSVMSEAGEPAVLAASDATAETLEQLQATLGEGPCREASALGRPVLEPDLQAAARSTWLGYAPALQSRGIQAVFSFPLRHGSGGLGALDVYREERGPLEIRSSTQAAAYADAALTALLEAQDRSREPAGKFPFDEALVGRFDIYQAQGMVQVQLGVSLHEAMARLRAHAYAQDRPLSELAADILARRLVLDGEP